MKRLMISLILPVLTIVACKKSKDHHGGTPAQFSIAGKWNVDSVTTYFYTNAGSLDTTEIDYPTSEPGLNYPLYFQFNDDYSWSESLVAGADTSVVSEGTYRYTSNSTFTLFYPDATPSRKDELCHVTSFGNTMFTFSKQLPTVFNGTDSGYIKYVYRLIK